MSQSLHTVNPLLDVVIVGDQVIGVHNGALCRFDAAALTGQDGATILTSAGAPTSGTGEDGDYYLDSSTADFYGPKAGGAWGAALLNLIGPQGDPGSDGLMTSVVAGTKVSVNSSDPANPIVGLSDMAANTVRVRNAGTSGAPADLAMAASTILARLASGDIVAASVAQIQSLLSILTTAVAATTYHPLGAIKGINAQSGTSYTLVAADAGKLVTCTNASPITLTVPKNIFGLGDVIYPCQGGAGQVTVTAGTGVTIKKAAAFTANLLEQEAMATLICVDDTTDAYVFRLGGQLELA